MSLGKQESDVTLKIVDGFVRLLLTATYNNENPHEIIQGLDPSIRDLVLKKFYETTVEIEAVQPDVLQTRRRASWEFDSSQGYFWNQLRKFHLEELRKGNDEVISLDENSDLVLQNLGNPAETGDTLPPVKGLVVGYVQSGKTANYTALIAKAFDQGYKTVIVLAGVHNLLRRQTQIRLENELGLVPDSPMRRTASKTAAHGALNVIRATSDDLTNGDFQYSNLDNNVLQNNRFLFVTKKNASVLRKLIKWIGPNNNSPTLIIDDEADQATPNTRGNRLPLDVFEDDGSQDPSLLASESDQDESPTEINKQIRILVGLFKNRSYVGYTATPFANVFMDDGALDVEAGEDLYPRDFIISLPKPNNYLGPEEFFGNDSPEGSELPPLSSRVIEIVEDEEVKSLDALVASPHGSEQVTLPPSLKQAIEDFLLATAIRRTVEKNRDASAMLVHSSRVTYTQRNIKEVIEQHLKILRNSWRYDTAFRETMRDSLKRFQKNVSDEKFMLSFDSILPELNHLLEKFSYLPVLLINYDSEDQLDYESQPDLTAIIVGGNKLSRGLTINGLITSYFVRQTSSPKADTLTQMGRFFGYKKAIAEITRIYTTDEIRENFRDAAEIEASLRRELKLYAISGKRPSDFAPRVLKRAALMPTAKNKMKAVTEIGISYSGDLIQMTSFPFDANGEKKAIENLSSNLEQTKQFLNGLGQASVCQRNNAVWQEVPTNLVIEFLGDFKVTENATRFVPNLIIQYIADVTSSTKSNELKEFTVAVIGRQPDELLGEEDFGFSNLRFGRVARAIDKNSKNSIGSLVNPLNLRLGTGDELIDFSENDIAQIRAAVDADGGNATFHTRNQRQKSKGLLLVYPISPKSVGTTKGKDQEKSLGEHLVGGGLCPTIVGLALVFPFTEISSPTYWSGPTGLEMRA